LLQAYLYDIKSKTNRQIGADYDINAIYINDLANKIVFTTYDNQTAKTAI
jgi:hypothetical protein